MRTSESSKGQRGFLSFFTMTELLVVIAIIAVLAAILLPALARAKYQAKLVICVNNQKQIVTGVLVYATDFDSTYPATTGTSALGKGEIRVARHKTWNTPNNTPYKTLSTYYSYPGTNNHGITYRNPIWQCPQGKGEQKYDDREIAYFSFHFDSWPGTGNWSYEDGFPSPHIPNNPQHIMKKTNQTKTLSTRWRAVSGSKPNPQYNILTSDVVHRIGHSGGGLSTNHIWGGDRDLIRFYYTAAWWRSFSGVADANYAFDDGSVSTFSKFQWSDIQAPTLFDIPGGGGQGGDPFGYPRDFRIDSP